MSPTPTPHRLVLRPYHPADGQDEVVIDRTPFLVGRIEHNDLRVRRADASRCHAEFHFADGAWWIVDRRSSNGTYVDGTRVTEPERVARGNLIHFGETGYSVVVDTAGHVHPDCGYFGCAEPLTGTSKAVR